LTLCSGGPVSGGWDACYGGPDPSPGFHIEIAAGSSLGPGNFKIRIYLLAQDNAGNSDYREYSYVTMPDICDD
jgi:hypothetical protein